MSCRRLVQRLSIAAITGAVLLGAGPGAGAADARGAVPTSSVAPGPGASATDAASGRRVVASAPPSPEVGAARVRPVSRAALRARYPYVKPPAPKPPAPAGPVVPSICRTRAAIVCASKRERVLRYYERGRLRVSTPVAFGRRGYETPSGLWTVKIKDVNAWSYEFNAPMPFSLEYDLVRGIYIHYSSTFARIGRTYIGSHGCINIGDYATARTLFGLVPVGAYVYVY